MDFEFEDFVIREVGHENRKMQTSKKVNNVSTDVTIFKVKGFDLSFDLLYCRGGNGDVWVVAEKMESFSKHLHRAQRTRMSIENYKEKQYCRLWQEVKKDEDWSRTKKSLPLSELGKYSKNPLRQSFLELGAKLGTKTVCFAFSSSRSKNPFMCLSFNSNFTSYLVENLVK